LGRISRRTTAKNENPAAEPHGPPQGCTVRPRNGTAQCSIGGVFIACCFSQQQYISFAFETAESNSSRTCLQFVSPRSDLNESASSSSSSSTFSFKNRYYSSSRSSSLGVRAMVNKWSKYLYQEHSAVAVSPLKTFNLLDVLIKTDREGFTPVLEKVGSMVTLGRQGQEFTETQERLRDGLESFQRTGGKDQPPDLFFYPKFQYSQSIQLVIIDM